MLHDGFLLSRSRICERRGVFMTLKEILEEVFGCVFDYPHLDVKVTLSDRKHRPIHEKITFAKKRELDDSVNERLHELLLEIANEPLTDEASNPLNHISVKLLDNALVIHFKGRPYFLNFLPI